LLEFGRLAAAQTHISDENLRGQNRGHDAAQNGRPDADGQEAHAPAATKHPHELFAARVHGLGPFLRAGGRRQPFHGLDEPHFVQQFRVFQERQMAANLAFDGTGGFGR